MSSTIISQPAYRTGITAIPDHASTFDLIAYDPLLLHHLGSG